LFTNKDVSEVSKIADQYKIEKQSKVGAISPVEITLPAGPTGMDASQVYYFQNLRIQTKVERNQLTIINATKILVVGQKITLSEINLMNKFNIKPFKHKISLNNVYLGGTLYDSGILSITNESMSKSLEKAIQNIAAFGLSSGISNKASAPHSVVNSFRNILGLSVGCDIELSQAKGLLQASKQPQVQAPKVEKKEEKAPADDKKKGGDDKGKKEDPKKGKEDPKKDAKKKKAPEPEQDEGADDDIGGIGGLF